jgi:muramoyltetrapeptide carboxypeptidase LdcA involved in peptidoglycan recycling
MLDKGVSVGLCACSNTLGDDSRDMIHELEYSLYDVGLNVASNDNLYGEFSGQERALMLNNMFADENIKAIFR